MRSRLPVEPVIAVAASVLVIAAALWWMLSDEQVAPREQPTYRGEPVQVITASLPALGDLERDYDVNDDNPFVPLLQRIAERKQIRANRTTKPTRTSEPPKVEEVTLPVLKFPAAAAWRADAPDCVGLISSAQGEVLQVRMPGAAETIAVAVGEAVPKEAPADRRWTLVAIEPGGIARFRDPSGAEQLFPIGALPSSIEPPKLADAKAPAGQPQAPHGPADPRNQPIQRQLPGLPPGGMPGSDRPRGWTPRPPSEAPPQFQIPPPPQGFQVPPNFRPPPGQIPTIQPKQIEPAPSR